jgi:predicted nucleic acid-binding protein
LVDALYVELAHRLGDIALVTTDSGLAASAGLAELVGP